MSLASCLDALVAAGTAEDGPKTMTREEVRNCIEALIKYLRPILQNDKEESCRLIKLSDTQFAKTVWCHGYARQFLSALGWVVDDDDDKGLCIRLPSETESSVVRDAISLLVEKRVLRPDPTAQLKLYSRPDQEKIKATEERRKMVRQAKEAAEAYRRQKEEDKRVAKLTIEEAKIDRKYQLRKFYLPQKARKVPPPKDRRANPNYIWPGDEVPAPPGPEDGEDDPNEEEDGEDGPNNSDGNSDSDE